MKKCLYIEEIVEEIGYCSDPKGPLGPKDENGEFEKFIRAYFERIDYLDDDWTPTLGCETED